MRVPRSLSAVLAAATLTGAALVVAPVASAAPLARAGHSATTHHAPALGTRSLAAVLLAHDAKFDHNPGNYDIVTQAVLAVLAADPKSPVAVLTDGTVPLTAFLPNDQAFRILVFDLTGKWISSEKGVFTAAAGLGIPTLEKVLLYHVVPGATITRAAALRSNGAALTTAEGGKITVRVSSCWWSRGISLIDNDPNARNPRIVQFNLNVGNEQIAHGINRVLRPTDL
jgi:uncharacterized surface protein with fasciclin (FAS1) repeats